MALPQIQCLYKRRGSRDVPYDPITVDCILAHYYYGGDAIDYSPNGNDGVVVGTPVYGSTGLTFSSGDKVSLDNRLGQLDPGVTGMTFVVWCATTASDVAVVLAGYNGSAGTLHKLISGTHMWVYAPEWGGVSYNTYTPADLANGTFHMLHWGYNFATGKYAGVNGVSHATLTDGAGSFGIPNNNTGYSIGDTIYNPFIGTIGEVYIYNTPKTDAQLLALFNATKSRYGV